MPSFPILYFLIPYSFFVLIFIVFSIFNVYHLLRYGIYNFNLYILTFIYIGGTIFILGTSWIVLYTFDWSTPFMIENILNPQSDYFNIYDAAG